VRRSVSLGVAAAVVAAIGVSALAPVAGARRAHAAAALPSLELAMNGRSIRVGGATVSGGVNVISTVTRVAQAEPSWSA
jgi:hypothetical protein